MLKSPKQGQVLVKRECTLYEKLLIMPISIKARIEKSVFVKYESRLQGSQGRGGGWMFVEIFGT